MVSIAKCAKKILCEARFPVIMAKYTMKIFQNAATLHAYPTARVWIQLWALITLGRE